MKRWFVYLAGSAGILGLGAVAAMAVEIFGRMNVEVIRVETYIAGGCLAVLLACGIYRIVIGGKT